MTKESFLVSARKYRPQNFETVIGQNAVTNTLMQAIENNQLAQAYLFCGPRGVGKTSCARIFAKEINRKADPEGAADFSFNLFELDAASNNSVDDIRGLIEQVRIQPQKGKYKVYIIDEVHMLSQSAFNAFLKTLEEPPKYAIFILATTEKHKIIPTILSRCQVFDFHRITPQDTVKHLEKIAAKEGVTADKDALYLVAEKSDGGMRDALSIYDQLVSSCQGHISYEKTVEYLNILDIKQYLSLSDPILEGNIAHCLLTLNDLLLKGFDAHQFLLGLGQHFRNLLTAQSAASQSLLQMASTFQSQYVEQAKLFSKEFLFIALDELATADTQYKSTKNQRLLVEITLLKLCSLQEHLKKKN